MESNNIAHDVAVDERTKDVCLKTNTPFQMLGLRECVLEGLERNGFKYPTALQAIAIPMGRTGIDMIIKSKSGTGKSLIFICIVLEKYFPKIAQPQSLIITPTRELAIQIDKVINNIGQYSPGFRSICVIGGMNVGEDRQRLFRVNCVVGTPGRIVHLLKSRTLNVKYIRTFILDEADKMYCISFRNDLTYIKSMLPSKLQIITSSATIPISISNYLFNELDNPYFFSTQNANGSLLGIKQFVYEMEENPNTEGATAQKLDGIRQIFRRIFFKQCVIFVSSQARASSFANLLHYDGWLVDYITAAQDQEVRSATFRKFCDKEIKIIVSTDLLSRGVDSNHLNLVINLDLPENFFTYMHRIGRAGRFGSHGLAISLITSEAEKKHFSRIMTRSVYDMEILKFPQPHENLDKNISFWDFSNAIEYSELFGVYDYKIISPPMKGLAPLASDDAVSSVVSVPKVTVTNIEETSGSSKSIDTKTFQIDSKDSAINFVDLIVGQENAKTVPKTIVASESTPVSTQYQSSNTIDDASSIAADSELSTNPSTSRPMEFKTKPSTDVDEMVNKSKAPQKSKPDDTNDEFKGETNIKPSKQGLIDAYCMFLIDSSKNINYRDELQHLKDNKTDKPIIDLAKVVVKKSQGQHIIESNDKLEIECNDNCNIDKSFISDTSGTLNESYETSPNTNSETVESTSSTMSEKPHFPSLAQNVDIIQCPNTSQFIPNKIYKNKELRLSDTVISQKADENEREENDDPNINKIILDDDIYIMTRGEDNKSPIMRAAINESLYQQPMHDEYIDYEDSEGSEHYFSDDDFNYDENALYDERYENEEKEEEHVGYSKNANNKLNDQNNFKNKKLKSVIGVNEGYDDDDDDGEDEEDDGDDDEESDDDDEEEEEEEETEDDDNDDEDQEDDEDINTKVDEDKKDEKDEEIAIRAEILKNKNTKTKKDTTKLKQPKKMTTKDKLKYPICLKCREQLTKEDFKQSKCDKEFFKIQRKHARRIEKLWLDIYKQQIRYMQDLHYDGPIPRFREPRSDETQEEVVSKKKKKTTSAKTKKSTSCSVKE